MPTSKTTWMPRAILLTPRRSIGVITCIFLAGVSIFYLKNNILKYSLSEEDISEANTADSRQAVSKYINSLGFTLNHESLCENGNGSPPDLLIVVTAAVPRFKERQVLRKTWGGLARSKGAKLIFLLGSTNDKKVQGKIIEENLREKDIVQAQFLDTYRNLTLKSVAMVKWVTEHCSRVKFFLKLDDDVVVNVDALLNFLTSRSNATKTIFGNVVSNTKPIRGHTKWRVTKEEYPLAYYPTYTTGGSYLLTGDAARPLYKESLRHKYLFIEDVFLTGLVAQEVAVKRVHNKDMDLKTVTLTVCTFHRMLMSNGHKPGFITKLWNDIKINKTNCKS